MDKISRILPPSRRVTSTDVESSQPVRPGAPEQGRPTRIKELDVQDRLNFSSLAASRPTEAPTTYKNLKETARAKAIDDLAEKFFNPKAVAKEGEGVQSEETLKRMEESQAFAKITPEKAEPIAKESLSQDLV